jgi:hypothetical protein
MSRRPKSRRLFLGSGGRGRSYRSRLLLAVLRHVSFTAPDEVLRGQQACGGELRARWFLRAGPKIESRNNASSFVLFSPRPHRQLAASSVISFELGDGNCRVAGPGEISRDRSSEETLERHPSWGVSQWLREEKKEEGEDHARGARPPQRAEGEKG